MERFGCSTSGDGGYANMDRDDDGDALLGNGDHSRCCCGARSCVGRLIVAVLEGDWILSGDPGLKIELGCDLCP